MDIEVGQEIVVKWSKDSHITGRGGFVTKVVNDMFFCQDKNGESFPVEDDEDWEVVG
jgi:hypothetical protein